MCACSWHAIFELTGLAGLRCSRQTSTRCQISPVCRRGSYNIAQKKPVPGSNFTQVVKGNATVKVDSSDYYVLVLANNGGNSPADVLYQFATYSANSTGEAPSAPELMQVKLQVGGSV